VVGIVLAVLFLWFLVMVLVGGGVEGHQIPQHAPSPDAVGPISGAILGLR
jgi:Na+-transporting methylmalonyl-CoA/oxaloacetate decarboxylase gamma subunit